MTRILGPLKRLHAARLAVKAFLSQEVVEAAADMPGRGIMFQDVCLLCDLQVICDVTLPSGLSEEVGHR